MVKTPALALFKSWQNFENKFANNSYYKGTTDFSKVDELIPGKL